MDRFAKVFFGYEIWADVAPDKKFFFYGGIGLPTGCITWNN